MSDGNEREYRQINPLFTRNSWEIAHETMTGGTFTVNKALEVLGDKEVYVHQYVIELPTKIDYTNRNQHKGIHTLEHLIAYSGGLRDALEKKTGGKLDRRAILDISPFVSNDKVSLRLLSATELDTELLREAVVERLKVAQELLLNENEPVPFGTEKDCGQFRFHSKEEAKLLVDAALEGFEILVLEPRKGRSQIAVADLRLLKPELEKLPEGEPPQIFLDPQLSYALTKYFEKKFPEYWKTVEFGIPPLLLAAKYGCETGAYIGFDSDNLLEALDEQAEKIHVVLTVMLMDFIKYLDNNLFAAQVQAALSLIKQFSEEVYSQAEQGFKKLPKRI